MLKLFTLLSLSSLALFAAEGADKTLNMNAVIMFFIFIVGTMGITNGLQVRQNLLKISILLVEEFQDSKMV